MEELQLNRQSPVNIRLVMLCEKQYSRKKNTHTTVKELIPSYIYTYIYGLPGAIGYHSLAHSSDIALSSSELYPLIQKQADPNSNCAKSAEKDNLFWLFWLALSSVGIQVLK